MDPLFFQQLMLQSQNSPLVQYMQPFSAQQGNTKELSSQTLDKPFSTAREGINSALGFNSNTLKNSDPALNNYLKPNTAKDNYLNSLWGKTTTSNTFQTATSAGPAEGSGTNLSKKVGGALKDGTAMLALDAVDSFLPPLDHQNAVQQGIDVAGDVAGMFGPWGKAIGAGLKGVSILDKALGKKANEQAIPVNQSIRGYDLAFNTNANTKYGGLFGNKARKQANRLTKRQDSENALKLQASEETQKQMTAAANLSPVLMQKNYQKLQGGFGKDQLRTLTARKGAKLLEIKQILKAKKGTKIKPKEEQPNIIPDGALHARKNNMELEGITHKGVPVVSYDEGGEVTQHAEIEKEELIFHKETTKKIEDLYKKYKEKEDKKYLLEVGKLLTYEILENTIDNVNLIKDEKN